MSYKDTTYCASPTCTNKCGRKPSDELMRMQQEHLNTYGQHLPLWWSYFCGEDGELLDEKE